MKTKNPELDWHRERIQWNKEGWCAREVCSNKHANYLNRGNDLLYCARCARLINEANPELVICVN